MEVKIEPTWHQALSQEWQQPYFAHLAQFVRQQYGERQVFPAPGRIFAAFDACPFDKTKVVILGQDPYHDVGQAHGLAFSVPQGVAAPPSLQNIFREVQTDLQLPQMPIDTNLERWARQGVLLLNATLTVEAHHAGSHQGHGWEVFTDHVIKQLNDQRQGLVFILWGSYAQRKGAFIDRQKHLVLAAPHPSPLSAYRGFFGSRPFSQANAYLQAQGLAPIDWR